MGRSLVGRSDLSEVDRSVQKPGLTELSFDDVDPLVLIIIRELTAAAPAYGLKIKVGYVFHRPFIHLAAHAFFAISHQQADKMVGGLVTSVRQVAGLAERPLSVQVLHPRAPTVQSGTIQGGTVFH